MLLRWKDYLVVTNVITNVSMRGIWGNQSQRGGYVTMEAVTGMILFEEGEGATCHYKWPLEAKKVKETIFL